MRRDEIIAGTLQLEEALEKAQIVETLQSALHFGRGQDSHRKESMEAAQVLHSFRAYSIQANQFSEATRKLVEIFNLATLGELGFWALLQGEEGGPGHPTLIEAYRSVQFARDYLPALVKLLTEGREQSHHAQIIVEGTARPTEVLTLLLGETEGRLSKPDRLIDALRSVAMLYEAVADIEQLPSSGLGVLSCDSGGDKSLDFLGLADVVKGVKELLLAVWDRVVFFREQRLAHRLELIAESLPILERLATLENSNALGREQCELIRRKIVDGVTRFLSCGGTIPEMSARSQFEPRLLMAPEPKLLTSAPEPEAEPKIQTEMSDEEKRLLKELQQKAAGTRPPLDG